MQHAFKWLNISPFTGAFKAKYGIQPLEGGSCTELSPIALLSLKRVCPTCGFRAPRTFSIYRNFQPLEPANSTCRPYIKL